MQDQPKFFPQRGTDFYADGRSVRPQVENTVARNQLHEDSYFYTGLVNGKEGDGMPFPVTMEVLERGQERYNVYCTPCHSRVGNGEGMIVQRGYAKAGDFHTARLETAPLGHFFYVITNGYGAMPDYSSQVTPADRWAIAAYIKALQLSQKATQADVPAGGGESLSSIAEKRAFPRRSRTRGCYLPRRYGTPDNGALCSTYAGLQHRGNGTRRHRAHAQASASRRTNRTEAVTSEASERRLETHGIWTRT